MPHKKPAYHADIALDFQSAKRWDDQGKSKSECLPTLQKQPF
jgi:hypothetical protein